MPIYRGTILDTPQDPFLGGVLRAEADGGLLVRDGVIEARGAFTQVRAAHPDEEVVDLSGGLVLPGFVDTHVHFPQVRVIGGLGMPLLDWLERLALPEEARLADPSYASVIAAEFVAGLAAAGTTSALVFGAHYASAVDLLFTEADRVGLRVTSGLVVSDRILREDLWITPERALADGLALAQRWHGTRLNRYAVTPRFSLSCSDALLASCGELLRAVPGAYFTSHVNENDAEIATVRADFPQAAHYVDTYARHGLVGRRSVLAHDVHPLPAELATLAAADASVAHCPTSNSSLGSGFFPMRAHVAAGVRVALGSDVGGGTGFSLFKEGLQAYFVQQLLGAEGLPLTAAHLLWLATAAGAAALELPVGELSVGRPFDALWLAPAADSTLDVNLRHAKDADDALAKAFALAGPADVAATWVAGRQIVSR